MKSQSILVALVGILLGLITSVILNKNTVDNPSEIISTKQKGSKILNYMPEYSYPDLSGKTRYSSEWKGNIIVLNFWAAWCPPCHKETPSFIELQKKYKAQKVRFIGIAIDDIEPVQDFVDTYGINYPILMGDLGAAALSRQLGNKFEGLPFTVVASVEGKIILKHTGELKKTQLEPILQKAIENYSLTQ
tara:strand:- start:219 stop:788 length:570 start_codon:yes stop_codon:yes gene_type:complete